MIVVHDDVIGRCVKAKKQIREGMKITEYGKVNSDMDQMMITAFTDVNVTLQ